MSTAHLLLEQPIENPVHCSFASSKPSKTAWQMSLASQITYSAGQSTPKRPRRIQCLCWHQNNYIHCLPSQSSTQYTVAGPFAVLKNLRTTTCIRNLLNPEAIEAAILAIAADVQVIHLSRTATGTNIAISLEPTTEAHFDTLAVYSKIEAVRNAARLVDMPPNKLNVTRFIQEARHIATEFNIPMQVIRGETLVEHNLGGIWAVGKGAAEGPALVYLNWNPPNPSHRVAWVGKGIVYDSGG